VELPVIALEYVSDRLRALLADRAVEVPAEAVDRIRMLETQLAVAHQRLIAEGHASKRLDAELPALAQAVADLQQRFDELIAEARAEIPEGAKAQIADLEKRLAAAQAEIGETRKQRDEAVRQAEGLAMLRDAAVRWRKDNYSPRLQSAIDTFLRSEVGKR
jgi:uncharacterized membrane protein YccC